VLAPSVAGPGCGSPALARVALLGPVVGAAHGPAAGEALGRGTASLSVTTAAVIGP